VIVLSSFHCTTNTQQLDKYTIICMIFESITAYVAIYFWALSFIINVRFQNFIISTTRQLFPTVLSSRQWDSLIPITEILVILGSYFANDVTKSVISRMFLIFIQTCNASGVNLTNISWVDLLSEWRDFFP